MQCDNIISRAVHFMEIFSKATQVLGKFRYVRSSHFWRPETLQQIFPKQTGPAFNSAACTWFIERKHEPGWESIPYKHWVPLHPLAMETRWSTSKNTTALGFAAAQEPGQRKHFPMPGGLTKFGKHHLFILSPPHPESLTSHLRLLCLGPGRCSNLQGWHCDLGRVGSGSI